MSGGVSHVHKKRAVVVVFGDELRRIVADRIGVVIVVGILRSNQRVVAGQRVGVKETSGPVNRAIETIESALARPVVLARLVGRSDRLGDMPLAGHVAAIARRAQHLGNGHATVVQVTTIAGVTTVVHHVADSGLVRVQPRHQAGPCRATAARVVELRETQSIGSQLVQSRRGDLASVTPDVRVPHVIGHDQDDVRTRRGQGRCGQRKN